MTNKESQSFYLAIIDQNLHINYFGSKDSNSDYQEKYLMPDSFDNNQSHNTHKVHFRKGKEF